MTSGLYCRFLRSIGRLRNVSDHKIERSGKHIFVMQYDLGENWSLFTKGLLSLIFEKLANVKAEIRLTPNTAIAEVTLR